VIPHRGVQALRPNFAEGLDKWGEGHYNNRVWFFESVLSEVMVMVLDLKKVFLVENEAVAVQTEVDLSELGANAAFERGKAAAEIEAVNHAGFVEFTADVKGKASYDCDRCAKTVTKDFHFQFRHILVTKLSEESGDDYIETPDYKLDTDALLRDDILLELPSKLLCSESCKGLCYKCGKNLNEGQCGCRKQEADPRLAALRQLLADDR